MKLKIAFSCALACAYTFAMFAAGQTPPVAPPAATPAPVPAAVAKPKEVSPEEVVMTIGADKVTRAQYEALLRNVPGQFQQAASAMGKKQFATQYAMMLGLCRTAEKEKMDQGVANCFLRMQLLAQLAFQQISQRNQVIPDEQVK